MTREQFADLVAKMRANQKFYALYGDKYKWECIHAENEVDDMLKRIYKGEQLT